MRLIIRRFKMIFFHSVKFMVRMAYFFSARSYMKLYIPLLKMQGMKIEGAPRYIGPKVRFDDYGKTKLGNRVVISDECILLSHDYSYTSALISVGDCPQTDIALVRDIVVGNNVFIGKRSIIMPGTTIGDNVIIGAGSVVRGKIPENSVVIGNPATVVGKVTDLAEKWKKYLGTDKIRPD